MRWATATELGEGDGSCDDTIGNFQFSGTVSTAPGTLALGGGVSVNTTPPPPAPSAPVLGPNGSPFISASYSPATDMVTIRTQAGNIVKPFAEIPASWSVAYGLPIWDEGPIEGFYGAQLAAAQAATFSGDKVTFLLPSGTVGTIHTKSLPYNLVAYFDDLPSLPATAPAAAPAPIAPLAIVRTLSGGFRSLGVAPSAMLAPLPTPAAASPPTVTPAVKNTALIVGGAGAVALLVWALL